MMVQELITGKLTRLLTGTTPVLSGLEAVNAAARAIGLELLRRQSDLAVEQHTLYYAAGSSRQELPEGFIGLASHPVSSCGELSRAADSSRAYELTSGARGKPELYEIDGDGLLIYPAPAAACQVTIRARVLPELELTDDLPFYGQLNDLIAVTAARLAQAGLSMLSDPAFLQMVDKGVGMVLMPRQYPLPRQRGIQYW